jgi:hypothetical protein
VCVGDLVRLRDIGMPGQSRALGVVREIQKKDHARWKGDGWDSVKVYWGENHRMNDRWSVRGALEVIDAA